MWTRKSFYAVEPSKKSGLRNSQKRGTLSGRSFHFGELTVISRTTAGIGTINGNLGASNEQRIQYEKDVKRIVNELIKLD